MNQVEAVSNILGILTIVGDILIVVLSAAILITKLRIKSRLVKLIQSVTGTYGLRLAWLVTLIATLGSLFYSEVAKFTPCTLCWYQRIFMYPHVILLGIALLRKERAIFDYALVLLGFGALIAGYHYLLQTTGFQIVPCSTVGYSVSCAEKFILRFGYITIPMMSLSAFMLAFLLIFYHKRYRIHK